SVFITGAATGIGEALVLKLDQMGWRVFGTYNRTPPDELIKKASSRVTMLKCNVADPEDINKAVETVENALGDAGLTLLISNAAMTGAAGPVETVNLDDFHFLMEVNFWGPIRICQAFLPLLRQYGNSRIIIVNSTSIFLTIPLGCSYPVSKSALSALIRHFRMEMEPFGIQVTSLEPGGVKTKMTGFTEEEEIKLWAGITPHLLPSYQKYFSFPGESISENFELWPPERFANDVYKKMILKKKWKPMYIIGPGVSALPIMHRLLSHSRIEKIFKKLFAVKF
ncbi:MAG: SDR family NAD(P)-dependent oxidoreductase, partial [archaeon]|nr:SDR family NAD(P)-dependent oxidoreductase [archaeon]